MLAAIDKGLERVGVSVEDQKKKMVGCNFDGASVMLGSKSGVAQKLKERVGNYLVPIHCVAHCLELAILDAVKEVPYLKTFQETVEAVFKYYYYSPKKRRELASLSDILDEAKAHYGGLKAVRWLASRNRALVALQTHYAVTVAHLENASTGKKEDAAKATGILKVLKSEQLVKYLHFMIDVTSVLSRLSVQFQKDDITINEVVCGIEKSITELKKLEKGGVHYQGFCNRYSEQNGKLVCGKDNKQELTLTHKGTNPMPSFQKLLNGISSYLEKRFESLTTEPVSCFKVFDHRFWPMTREDLLHYGDDDVKTLVQHFAVLLSDEEKKCILSEWLQLKLLLSCQRAVKPLELYASLLISKPDSIKNVLVLVEIMTVLSPCTASCERSFSAMNRIKTSLKTTMQQGTLQDLMTVSSSSEDIKSFDPKPAISNWFLSGGIYGGT